MGKIFIAMLLGFCGATIAAYYMQSVDRKLIEIQDKIIAKHNAEIVRLKRENAALKNELRIARTEENTKTERVNDKKKRCC